MVLRRLTGLSLSTSSSMFNARKVFNTSAESSSKCASENDADASVRSSWRMVATSDGHESGVVHKHNADYLLLAASLDITSTIVP